MLGTKLEKFASNQEEKIFEIILNMRSSLIPEPEKKWIPESPKSQILFNSLTSSPNLMAMPQSRKNFSFNVKL